MALLDLDFFARTPDGPAPEVITDIFGATRLIIENWVSGIRIHASSNFLEKSLSEAEQIIIAGGEVPWPMGAKVPRTLEDMLIAKISGT